MQRARASDRETSEPTNRTPLLQRTPLLEQQPRKSTMGEKSVFIEKHGLFLTQVGARCASCGCCMVHPRASTYHLPELQVMFSLLGFVFCVTMLIKGKEEGVYLPVLTGIIGVWTPSPLSQGNRQRAGVGEEVIVQPPTPTVPNTPFTPGGVARAAALNTTSTVGDVSTGTGSHPGSPSFSLRPPDNAHFSNV
jgi:hypothetical protein